MYEPSLGEKKQAGMDEIKGSHGGVLAENNKKNKSNTNTTNSAKYSLLVTR